MLVLYHCRVLILGLGLGLKLVPALALTPLLPAGNLAPALCQWVGQVGGEAGDHTLLQPHPLCGDTLWWVERSSVWPGATESEGLSLRLCDGVCQDTHSRAIQEKVCLP